MIPSILYEHLCLQCQRMVQVDRSATIEIKIADDNRQAEFDFDA